MTNRATQLEKKIKKLAFPKGNPVYLKKTGEKFSIYDKAKDGTYTIMDEYGTGFYGIKKSEFKNSHHFHCNHCKKITPHFINKKCQYCYTTNRK